MKRYSKIIISIIVLISSLFSGNGELGRASANADAPVTTHTIIGNRHVSGIYYGNVEFRLTASNSGSGISETRYSMNNGESWEKYNGPLTFSDKKVYHILYQSINSNNSIEVPKSADFTIKQDYFPPETTVNVIGTEGLNAYYISPVTISLIGTDAHSAIDYSEYSLDGGQTWNRYSQPFSIDTQQNNLFYYRSRDVDGNLEKMKKYKINMDLVPPTAPNIGISPELWSNSSFKVTIFDGIDEQSGTLRSQYRLDLSGTWLDYSTPVTVSGDGYKPIYVRTMDFAGNTSDVAEFILQFDKISPTVPTLELSDGEWTNDTVYVSVYDGSDQESLIRGYEFKKGADTTWTEYAGSFSVKEEGITTVYTRSVDKAGNVSPSVEDSVKIDYTPPSAPENLFKVNQLGTSALIRWSAGVDSLSGVNEYDVFNGDVFLGTTQDTKMLLTDLVAGEKYSITVRSVDHAGNPSESSRPLVFYANGTTVSSYRDHNFAWNVQGNVWGWGINNRGQLGDGTSTDKTIATNILSLAEFSMISTGLTQNIGLRPDGTVWTWGEDSRGQAVSLSKVEGLEDIISISSGLQHYLALKEDGTVWAWGNNDLGQSGNGTTNYSLAPVQVQGLDSVVSVVASYYNSMALLDDGSVWIWGYGIRGILGYDAPAEHKQLTPIKIAGLENIIQIDMSYLHGAALRNDGTVWTWGFNESGRLGDGSVVDRSSPQQVQGLTEVIKVSASYAHSLALTEEGKVWAWGNNYYGELGDGSGIQKRLIPVRSAHLEGMVDIEAGELYSMAVKRDGSLWSWGNNMYGQLGIGNTTSQVTRNLVNGIPFPTDTLSPTVPGALSVTGKTSNTAVLSWLESTDNHAVKEYLIYKGTTLVHTLQIDGNTIDYSTGYTVTGLAEGTDYTFTVKARDYAGNVSSSSNEVSIKTDVSLPMAVSAGANNTMALKSDGSVWSWGSNTSGQLGDGTLSSSLVPKQAINVNSITAIASGNSFSLALKSDGTVWGWGQNTIGQLGNTTLTSQQYKPKKIENFDSVVAISAGSTHALALKSDGTVWSWGSNFNGELGIGTTTNAYVPTKISSLSGVKAISAGMFFSYALKTDGTVWAWGTNNQGQLGNGSTNNQTVPVKISSLSSVDSIASGLYHGLALKQDGTVWSWGYNNNGQIGDGTYTVRLTPVKVTSLSGIKQISAGMYHSLARAESEIYSWGSNSYGQLGNNSTSGSTIPVRVSTLTSTKDIDVGFNHNAVVTSNNVMTWGNNVTGELGNGTTTNSKIPVTVKNLVPSTVTSNKLNNLQNTMFVDEFQTELKIPFMIEIPDLIAPSTPQNVTGKVVEGKLLLNWEASTDNFGVKEYWIYNNQELLIKTTSTFVEVPYLEGGVSSITIWAIDSAGNNSTASMPITP
ncbi:alpha-tubulin suppressor-like RCC1 family protein [Fontibacillus solani]|uniref:Alpha-tubulin suppressor-like RCC1 family protein n=1 Tax=Fontibacillus solani TaxID=1572857 RepID=A0A7W3XQL4_9BACL|nr:fibronectin type III domain-containing protein [Fontibacillus solani]MBA9084618.1 alpha-tubulin suppressor-like RCC1 family protein [Fontibacillus solani]